VEVWGTVPLGDEKADKHANRGDIVFRLPNAQTMSPVEEKGAKGFGGKSFRVLTQDPEQRKQGQAIVSQGGFRGAAMGTHPIVKCQQELGVGRSGFERCSRRDVTSGFEKGNQITGAP